MAEIPMNRRSFLAGLTATAAGLLIPARKVWALDRTMIPVKPEGRLLTGPDLYGGTITFGDYLPPDGDVDFLPIFWVGGDGDLYGGYPVLPNGAWPVYRYTGDPPGWLRA